MASRILTSCLKPKFLKCRHVVQIQPTATSIHEADRRGEGYQSKIRIKHRDRFKRLAGNFVPELAKLGGEWHEALQMDSIIPRMHGDYEIPWKFNTKDKINEWVVTTDSDHNEGYSRAKFELGKNRKGILHGYVDTRVPKDGKTAYAGYANIKGPEKFRSFERQIPYDFTHYNTLMVRLRGDGRPYQMIIQMHRTYDVLWFDQYSYPIFTRGGPYWQETFIPFNKFYFSSKGRVQTKQCNLIEQLHQIRSVGVTLMDGETGPFRLELDYIGLYYDASLNEYDTYELYQVPSYKGMD